MKAVKETERKYYKYQEEYRTFVQPVLTSNGILGGDSFAVDSNTLYNSSFPAWNAFDSTRTVWWGNSSDTINYYIIYNPNPLNITNINIKNYNGDGASLSGYWYSSSGSVYGSNDGVEWVIIKQYSNNISAYNATWDISLEENTNYYKYYKIDSTSYHPFGSEGWSIQEIILTADENARILIESDESDYDFYKDIDTYKLPKEVVRKYYKYNDIDWTQPVLTSNTSSNLMTVSATTEYDSNNASWKAFDNSDSTAWITNIVTNTGSLRVQFDKILRINSITVTGFRNASSYCKTVEIYKDINNTKLIGEQKQFYTSTGNTLNGIQTWTFDTPVETDFLSFYSTSPVINGWTGISNIVINAVELNIIESTESDYDFYEDKIIYYGIGE